MSFAVTIEKIEKVWTHPNADKLDLAKVESMSYQFVVGKDSYKSGDLVVYFPIDSLLTVNLIAQFELEGKLSGPEKNRIKSTKIRGEISQGFVTHLENLFKNSSLIEPGTDLTEILGIEKYEAPAISCKSGQLVPLPYLVSKYDIEGVEKYGIIVDSLMNIPCLITEKIEGSHFAAVKYPNGEKRVCQRNYQIVPIEGYTHDWWKVAETCGIFNALDKIAEEYPESVITIRGEVVGPGVQGNYYKLKDHECPVFEIELDGKPVNVQLFLSLCEKTQLKIVPILSCNITLGEWLSEENKETVDQASTGLSRYEALIDEHKIIHNEKKRLLREGVVIRPMIEMRDPKLGRVLLKKRSPEYLAKSEY